MSHVIAACRHLGIIGLLAVLATGVGCRRTDLLGGGDHDAFSDAAKFKREQDTTNMSRFGASTRSQEIEKDLGVR